MGEDYLKYVNLMSKVKVSLTQPASRDTRDLHRKGSQPVHFPGPSLLAFRRVSQILSREQMR